MKNLKLQWNLEILLWQLTEAKQDELLKLLNMKSNIFQLNKKYNNLIK